MELFLIVFGFFMMFVIFMAVGVMRKNGKPISGSCGGLNTAMQDAEGKCLTCGTTVDKKTQQKLMDKLQEK